MFFIMTASIQLSSLKLQDKDIHTLVSHKITEGGAVKSICFDKTGTLTELEVLLYGFIVNDKNKFDSFARNLEDLYYTD